MSEQEKSFLGRGWSFPPTFNKERVDVEMVKENEDIRESLNIYFSTKVGERIIRGDYGCIIHDFVFQSASQGTLRSLESTLTDIIRNYEPRILVHQVTATLADEKAGLIQLNVDYEVQSTNTRDNIVFPFYLNEGTSIKS
ncbi:GPW/gp25 family protein [Flavobacteriaceae bacterium]|jgi:uncharacterized protein|nr:GPW/gp25 family protein [Flavobacteriaceae bacterium]MDA8993510.1 GPW/gp25 family protein [Flavobacteriaceae bacterium]